MSREPFVIDPDTLRPKTMTFRFPTLEKRELMERARRGDHSAYDALIKQSKSISELLTQTEKEG